MKAVAQVPLPPDRVAIEIVITLEQRAALQKKANANGTTLEGEIQWLVSKAAWNVNLTPDDYAGMAKEMHQRMKGGAA